MSSPRGPSLLMLSIVALAFSGCLQTSVGVRVGDSAPSAHIPEAPPSSVAKGPPPWAPAHGRRAKHDYRYYPQAAVYRDDVRGLWFYYEDGKWTAGANLPVGIRIEVGAQVTVSMDTDTPYLHHDAVAERYPPGETKVKHNNEKKNGKSKN
ncbi:MAG: hypothetical protein P1P84_14690 [Deferrisomatales bacterium]|nr:hypothetical protein [Deferrisomatales bacterium]